MGGILGRTRASGWRCTGTRQSQPEKVSVRKARCRTPTDSTEPENERVCSSHWYTTHSDDGDLSCLLQEPEHGAERDRGSSPLAQSESKSDTVTILQVSVAMLYHGVAHAGHTGSLCAAL